MRNVATITWLTFHEARRRSMVLVALALGIVFLALYAIGFLLVTGEMAQHENSEVELTFGYNLLLIAGFYVVHFLTVMLAIFSSVDTVAGEIASHTIQTIVTKPLRRWQVMLGKWLGFALMISLYVALLAGGILLEVYLLVGYLPPNALQGGLLLIFEALVLVSLSLLGGTHFSTLTNGVTLFMLYGVAFVGSWVEQIGSLLQSQGAVRVGVVSSLLLPVEAMWRRAAYLMQPSFLRQIPSPFTTGSVPSSAMVIYAGLYAAVALILAMRTFSRRDL